ncbi:ATP-binding cassette domain-containing protein [Paenibacillus yanchengensis]|uniref:ATP-binding cassette domain-containing protein n=1 Tax=Paenibacillus yanchengensis TaxID=2035833 RepID=A0ABW4YQ29_9BACL
MNIKAWRTDFKATRNEMLMRLISLLGYGILLALLIDAVIKGDISVGAFAAIFASIAGVMELIEELLDQQIKSIFRFLGPSRNYFRVLDWPERSGTEQFHGIDQQIVLKEVYFRYPHAAYDALQAVNMTIKKGETIAIVGENGSGKSTLSKLLLGLYLPTEGKVFYDEKCTADLSFSTIFHQHSAVFQSFLKYGLNVEENVKISDWYSSATIESSLAELELNLNNDSFPQGKDTVLSKEFGGVDLSGGQWQRVAIARGIYRRHHFIVLDEPTAAIDPLEEQRVFKQFMRISKGKTAIIVTHRLGSAKLADRIIVMEKGSIVEMGTHAELLQCNGKYSQMFYAQAQWYMREAIN